MGTQVLARFSEDDFLSKNVVSKLLLELLRQSRFHSLLANMIGELILNGHDGYFWMFQSLLGEKRGTGELTFEVLRMVVKKSPSQVYDLLERVRDWHPTYQIPQESLKGHEVYSLMLLPAYFLDIQDYLKDARGEWPPGHPLLISLESPGEQRK